MLVRCAVLSLDIFCDVSVLWIIERKKQSREDDKKNVLLNQNKTMTQSIRLSEAHTIHKPELLRSLSIEYVHTYTSEHCCFFFRLLRVYNDHMHTACDNDNCFVLANQTINPDETRNYSTAYYITADDFIFRLIRIASKIVILQGQSAIISIKALSNNKIKTYIAINGHYV